MGTNNIKLALTEEQTIKFKAALKVGVFKQLHKKNLITDEQLEKLTNKNKNQ